MSLGERIPDSRSEPADAAYLCGLASRWGISVELAQRLYRVAGEVPYSLLIISGFRTAEEQEALRQEGRPAAPDDVSTHRSCPATGADVWPGIGITGAVKAQLGAAAGRAGLRWGGGSPIDPDTGIPSDWNHLDLGPRR